MGRREGPKTMKERASGNGGGREQAGHDSNGNEGAPIGDPRFVRLHTDPRFQRLPKNKAKVSVDSRFAHMFTEKGFNDRSGNKRGIKSKTVDVVDPLRRYYKLDEEEDEDLGLDGDARVKVSVAKKKRGKKERAERHQKELGALKDVEIDEGVDSEDEAGGTDSEINVHVNRKHVNRKQAVEESLDGKKTDARTGVEIVEGEVDSDDSEVKLEEVEEESDGQGQRARAGNGSVGKQDSNEESEDDDDVSGLEEGREEEDEEESTFSSSSSSSSSDSDGEVEELSEAEDEEKIPTTNDETRRLAMVNMDWEHIRAVHLLVLMRSFAPKGGRVYSVTIYPSEFGIEQMREENLVGPKSIFRTMDEDDEEGADPEKLREYEKARLRYYYAVAECDSVSTATHLYKNCDGLEFERTSNTLDLRYIPDEMKFKRAPRDTANEVPVDFKPVEFETKALQHSNVKLTWDDDEPVRVKALRRNFNHDTLNEMDFRAYVGSSSESESEAEAGEDVTTPDGDENEGPEVGEDKKEKVRSKYLSLLAGTEESGMVWGKKAERGNIEIKFHTGLEELSERLLEKAKKDKADETVWEAYLRRKKEKKNARRNKKAATESDVSSEGEEIHNHSHNGDPFFSHGDSDPFDDPFFIQGDEDSGPSKKTQKGRESKEGKMKDLHGASKDKRKKKEDAAREKKEAEKKVAELELLLLDDHMVQNGEFQKVPNLENPLKKQKPKKGKGAKGKREELQEKIVSSVNYEDPRFASLFTSHHFAVDPTDPQYKKTGSHVAEMQRQRFQSSKNAEEEPENRSKQDEGQHTNRKRKAELSSLVQSLKSKVQAKASRNERR